MAPVALNSQSWSGRVEKVWCRCACEGAPETDERLSDHQFQFTCRLRLSIFLVLPPSSVLPHRSLGLPRRNFRLTDRRIRVPHSSPLASITGGVSSEQPLIATNHLITRRHSKVWRTAPSHLNPFLLQMESQCLYVPTIHRPTSKDCVNKWLGSL